jgi:hypothetical protein
MKPSHKKLAEDEMMSGKQAEVEVKWGGTLTPPHNSGTPPCLQHESVPNPGKGWTPMPELYLSYHFTTYLYKKTRKPLTNSGANLRLAVSR